MRNAYPMIEACIRHQQGPEVPYSWKESNGLTGQVEDTTWHAYAYYPALIYTAPDIQDIGTLPGDGPLP